VTTKSADTDRSTLAYDETVGESKAPNRVVRLATFQDAAKACTRCEDHEPNLLHVDEQRGCARPMLQRSPTGFLGILVVGEAPNWDDTFDMNKGHLTYDADTDPTGRFMRTLLIEEVGLSEHEIRDVLFANAVLCLPAEDSGKHRVTRRQLDLCRPWLVRFIEDADVKVIVTMGATPLRALNHVERHRLTLRTAVGKLHPWFGRQLLPLYHPGLLGRVTRNGDQQRQDIRALRKFLGR